MHDGISGSTREDRCSEIDFCMIPLRTSKQPAQGRDQIACGCFLGLYRPLARCNRGSGVCWVERVGGRDQDRGKSVVTTTTRVRPVLRLVVKNSKQANGLAARGRPQRRRACCEKNSRLSYQAGRWSVRLTRLSTTRELVRAAKGDTDNRVACIRLLVAAGSQCEFDQPVYAAITCCRRRLYDARGCPARRRCGREPSRWQVGRLFTTQCLMHSPDCTRLLINAGAAVDA